MPEPVAPTNHLDAALQLATCDLRVLPIKPGAKHPGIPDWPNKATTNPDIIHRWYTQLYRNHGIGIATGSGIIVLDIDTHGADGYTTLNQLTAKHGALPDTVTCNTGSGGQHIYLRTKLEIRNNAGTKLGPGIDLRGDGGQVLAPPTLHPTTHRPYTWASGRAPWEHDIAPAPHWLETLLNPPPPVATYPAPPPTRDPFLTPTNTPADRYNTETTWAQLLTADGWTATHTDRDGVTHWTRPGKNPNEGTSATTGHNGKDFLHVFTTSIPWLPEGNYTRFAYTAHRNHGGDYKALTAHLRLPNLTPAPTPQIAAPNPAEALQTAQEPTPDADTTSTWTPIDLTPYFTGTHEPLQPTILQRTDATHLLYPGRLNMIFGESASGKTWIALTAATQQLNTGHHIAYIDLEDHPQTITERLTALGTKPHQANQIHYIRPETRNPDEAHHHITQLIHTHNPTLLILDSYGEALALFGIDQNDDNGVAHFTQNILRPWTRQGPAILILDHIPKNTDAPRNYSIGSQRKRASIDGAAYRATQTMPFSKHQPGQITLTTAKDRGGNLATGLPAATLTITPTNGQLQIDIHPPETRLPNGQIERPTTLMNRVLELCTNATNPPTKTELRDLISGKNEHKDQAIAALKNDGKIRLITYKHSETGRQRTGYICVAPDERDPFLHPIDDDF
jgi:hypothetical protein